MEMEKIRGHKISLRGAEINLLCTKLNNYELGQMCH